MFRLHGNYWTGTNWQLILEIDCTRCHFQAQISSATLADGRISLTGAGFNEAVNSNIVYVERVDDPFAECGTTIAGWTDQTILADSDVTTDATYCAELGDTVVVPCALAEVVLQNPLSHIPVPAAPDISINNGSLGRSQVSPNDPDVGDLHTYTVATPPVSGTAEVSASGLVIYTPDPVNPGPTDSLTVMVTDQAGNSGSVTISIQVFLANMPPVTVADPPAGVYQEPVTVYLSSEGFLDPRPRIYYTVDGSTPTELSPVYSTPLTFATTTTLRYFAVGLEGNQEAVQTATYTINYAPAPAAPSIAITQVDTGRSQVSANDPNPDDLFNYWVTTLPMHGDASVNENGLVTYNPDRDYVGEDSLIVTVRDQQGASGTVTIPITVTPAPPSTTWYVGSATGSDNNPGDNASQPFATISRAMASAQNGDLVKVAEGVYSESVTLDSFSMLTIQGGWDTTFALLDPVLYRSILNGTGAGSVGFDCRSAFEVIIEGMEITNFGEGVYILNNDYSRLNVTVQNCTISNSTYGVNFHEGYMEVLGSRVHDCEYGIYGPPNPGWNTFNMKVMRIEGNRIFGNTNGIYMQGATPTYERWLFANNLFYGNVNYNIYTRDGAHPWVLNNTIVGGAFGVAVTVQSPWAAYGDVGNNVITGVSNTAIYAPNSKTLLTAYYNDLYNNAADYFGTMTFGIGETHDIYVDPLLDADYHLQPGSPCIDAGGGRGLSLVEYDIDGDPRSAALGGDGLNDIGADEVIYGNSGPVPSAPAITVIESGAATSQVSPNDPDPGDTHTYSMTAAPAFGTADVDAAGLVTYVPNADYVGPDSLTVTVTDQAGASGGVTISITVNPETEAPVSSAAPAPGLYQETVTVTLSVSDNLDPNPVIYYTVDGSAPTQASLIYAAPLVFTSSTTLQYFAMDRRGNQEAVQTAAYTIIINYAPAPTAPAISVTESGAGTSQILPNDPDPGDTHTYNLTAAPAFGTANVDAAGLVTYQPNAGHVGPDSLSVTVTDQAGASGSVTITITVNPETEPPLSSATPAPGIYEETVTVTLSVVDNLDPSPVIYYTVDGTTPTQAGPVYATPLTFASTTTLQYLAVDRRGNTEAVNTALYTINNAPVPTAPSISITQVDTGRSQVSSNDPNPDDVFNYWVTTLPMHGDASVGDSGLVTYNPDRDYVGEDSLIVTVRDQQGASGTVTIPITVTPAPASTTWYVSSATGSDNNPGDNASQPFATISRAMASAQNGDLVKVAEGVYSESVTLDSFSMLTIQGGWDTTFALLDPALYRSILNGTGVGSVGFDCRSAFEVIIEGMEITNFGEGVYILNNDYSRLNVTVQDCTISNSTYGVNFYEGYMEVLGSRVHDCEYGLYGPPNPGWNTFNMKVMRIEGNRIFGNTNGIYMQGATPTAKLWLFSNNLFYGNVDYNIYTRDAAHPYIQHNTIVGGAFGVAIMVQSPWAAYGDVGNNIITGISNTAIYAPGSKTYLTAYYNDLYNNAVDYLGTMTWQITETHDIYVDPLLDADYHLQPGSPCIDAGGGRGLSLVEYDIDGDPRSGAVGGDGLHDIGADEYFFTNSNPVPAAPAISVTESGVGTSQVSPNDPDSGDTHTYSVPAAPAYGTADVDAVGLVTYLPNVDYVGPDSLTVTVTDQAGGSGSVTISITVNLETEAPVSSAAPAPGLYQETVTVTLSVSDNLDPGPVIYYTVDGSAPTQASPVYAAPLVFTSSTTLQYFAMDRRGNAEGVNGALYTVNHAPRPSALNIITAKNKTGTSQIDPGDPDAGDTHTYTLTLPPISGTATVDRSGLVTYTPNTGFTGQDSLTVDVTDQNGGSGTVTLTVHVADSPCTDEDRDGYSPEGDACGPVDCDPINPDIHPGAEEICGNSVDENCDWVAERCTIHDVAVTSLRVPSKVRNCSSRTKRIRAEISNPGEFPEIISVQLTANGSQLEQSVTLDPGSVARVSFDLNPASLLGPTAEICLEAVIPATDATPADNRVCSTVTVVNCQ